MKRYLFVLTVVFSIFTLSSSSFAQSDNGAMKLKIAPYGNNNIMQVLVSDDGCKYEGYSLDGQNAYFTRWSIEDSKNYLERMDNGKDLIAFFISLALLVFIFLSTIFATFFFSVIFQYLQAGSMLPSLAENISLRVQQKLLDIGARFGYSPRANKVSHELVTSLTKGYQNNAHNSGLSRQVIAGITSDIAAEASILVENSLLQFMKASIPYLNFLGASSLGTAISNLRDVFGEWLYFKQGNPQIDPNDPSVVRYTQQIAYKTLAALDAVVLPNTVEQNVLTHFLNHIELQRELGEALIVSEFPHGLSAREYLDIVKEAVDRFSIGL